MNFLITTVATFVVFGLALLFWQTYSAYPMIAWGVSGLILIMIALDVIAFMEDFPTVELMGRQLGGRRGKHGDSYEDDYY